MLLSILLAVVVTGGHDPYPGRYREPIEASRPIRQRQFDEINAYTKRMERTAPAKRDDFFTPDFSDAEAFQRSTIPLRATVRERLGFPPPLIRRGTTPQWKHVADDAYASLFRLHYEVLEGVEAYGILCVPHGLTEKAPLLVCQHGGGGNPELIYPMMPEGGTGNYGWMVQRALQEGYVTYSPAMIFPYGGKEEIHGPNRRQLDERLRYLGTSIIAVELWKIFRGIDAAGQRPEVDRTRIGMMGLSYGGQYTLYAAALDTRIQVAVSSCYFNERMRYAWSDWSFFNFFNECNDAELCALICPRPLLIEVGEHDQLFAVEGAKAEAKRAKRYWNELGMGNRFVFDAFSGEHEFNGGKAYDFIRPYLRPRGKR
jgi:dienelactone hydrolase